MPENHQQQNQNAQSSQVAAAQAGQSPAASEAMANEPATGNAAGNEPPADSTPTGQSRMDPVRKATFITLGAIVLLLAWHLVSDRFAPVTTQARVHALVVPIAAEVSGTVKSVDVSNSQRVSADQILFSIDPERYEFAVQAAEADLQTARQSMGASTANVSAAEASLVSAQANLERSSKDAMRLNNIKKEDPGAISQRRIESAEANFTAAQGQVDAARANVEKARQDLGESGEQNSRIIQAQSALASARLNLERTVVRAPDDGLVTDVRVSNGNYANASSPQMTFIALNKIWVQADFTENNLGHIKAGNRVSILFDALPGETFDGKVNELGFGVEVDTAPLGSLPTINNDRNWLRAEQRFPVTVSFDLPSRQLLQKLRVGSQATVVVYTGDNGLINSLASLQMWCRSKLTYAY